MKIQITFNKAEREAVEKLMDNPFKNRGFEEKYGVGSLTVADEGNATADIFLHTDFVVDLCSKASELANMCESLITTAKKMFKEFSNKWEEDNEYNIFKRYEFTHKYAVKTKEDVCDLHFIIDDEGLCAFIKECEDKGISIITILKISDYLKNNK